MPRLSGFRAAAAVAPLLFIHATRAGAQDTTVAREMAKHTSSIELANGVLRGAGADLLFREAAASQFLLVGESHGMRELPQIVSALYAGLQPAGYRHLAIEAGPISAERMQTMARSKQGSAALETHLRSYPFSLPFFFWREERTMLERVATTTPGPDVLWGLDQEFVLSPTFHFERLVQLARTTSAKAVAEEFLRLSRAADERMTREKNPRAVFMATATHADMDRLTRGLRGGVGVEGDRILAELSVSREIYQRFYAGENWSSNEQRAQLLKQHFGEYYRRAVARGDTMPRVLFKFGAAHVLKGRTTNNTYDLGSLAHEFAGANGSRALTLLVVVRRGTQNAWFPFSRDSSDRARPFQAVTDGAGELTQLGTPTVLSAVQPDAWQLVDLRPLRPLVSSGRLGRPDAGIIRLVWAVDFVLVVPEGHASTLYP